MFDVVEGIRFWATIVVPPDEENSWSFSISDFGLIGHSIEFVMNELDEMWAESAAFEKVATNEDIVAVSLDYCIHSFAESFAEGFSSMLCYCERNASADVGVGKDCEPQFYQIVVSSG